MEEKNSQMDMNQETTPAPVGLPAKKKAKWKLPLLIVGGVLVGIILLAVGCSRMLGMTMGGLGEIENEYSTSDTHVSVLYVDGVISSEDSTDLLSDGTGYDHQFILDTIDEAIYNDTNVGILLVVNTPGGGVYESDELYLKLMEYKQTTGRPVYVYMASMAASGGYYISAAADKIIANRNCWTGSIGVTMGTFYDVSGLLDQYGVKTVTITSGENKAMGSYTEPMTTEQREIFQSLIDEAYDQFVGIVAAGRDMKKKDVVKLADGRIYTAAQALELGLIDAIGTREDAETALLEDNDLKDASIIDFYPEETSFWDTLMGEVHQLNQPKGDVASLMSLMAQNRQIPIAYLCTELSQ